MSRLESQYVEPYLDTTADPATRYTPDTYLAYTLHGKAKDYSVHYRDALMRAIRRRVDAGTVVPAKSVRGAVAYVRRPQ
jgi:hypothetical protein